MGTALAALTILGAYLAGLITPFFRARWDARFQLFKAEWEHLHDDYAGDVGYEAHDPGSKIEYARDRHASLPRYLRWETERFASMLRKRFRKKPTTDWDD
ncbi:MAG: hypothetical protein WA989_06905 [Henriciella sp.]|uniref:hypothetical protein n=1 Tax=Henriciella sp. TaxID=1968823 RepID=UPI003C775A55